MKSRRPAATPTFDQLLDMKCCAFTVLTFALEGALICDGSGPGCGAPREFC